MSIIAHENPTIAPAIQQQDRPPAMSFPAQVGMLAGRALLVNIRVPFTFFAPLLISAFFLFIYQGQLGGVAGSFLPGQSYLGFILPLAIISAALSGSALAGETIVTDITRGYFDKLLLTPANRWALLFGPMVAGALFIGLQTVVVLVLGLALGLVPVTGPSGLLVVVSFALLLGVGFSGLTIGVGLFTGNSAATGGSSFLLFPLTFLTATFVPVDQLQGWIKGAAQLNPITYVLEAMRTTINTGWDTAVLARGLGAGLLLFGVFFGFALLGLRARTRRR